MLDSVVSAKAVLFVLISCAKAHPYLLIVGVVLTHFLRTRYRPGLQHVPGPFIASFTCLWRFNVVRKKDMPWTSIRLHQKYGPLVRIGPNHVSVAHPDALKVIYGNDSTYRKVIIRPSHPLVSGGVLMIALDCILYHSPSSLSRRKSFKLVFNIRYTLSCQDKTSHWTCLLHHCCFSTRTHGGLVCKVVSVPDPAARHSRAQANGYECLVTVLFF